MNGASAAMNSDQETSSSTNLFHRLESEVRYYCRKFPVVFETARGSEMTDAAGRTYIDLLCGCGSLNVGHNHPMVTEALIRHLSEGRLLLGLDLHTREKEKFLAKLHQTVLSGLSGSYKVQCVGPTGANAIEAAVKLARKITRRRGIIAFTNAFHGVTTGALALTGDRGRRTSAGISFPDVVRWPFDGYALCNVVSLELLDTMLRDPSSGIDLPAAILIETVQGEGGVNVASVNWLQRLSRLARDHGALLIVDEIQTGCGRTGPFFSFERAGLTPDVIAVAKSIGGGLPLSLLLLRTEHDQWSAGEHNGTFRGPSLSFTAGAAMLDIWSEPAFRSHMVKLSDRLARGLTDISAGHGEFVGPPRGIGLMRGLPFHNPTHAAAVQQRAFELGVLVELCGPHDEVLKFMPALNMPLGLLDTSLDRIATAIAALS
jgi:diaminobutyrate-2-oxoglutarate transaminase